MITYVRFGPILRENVSDYYQSSPQSSIIVTDHVVSATKRSLTISSSDLLVTGSVTGPLILTAEFAVPFTSFPQRSVPVVILTLYVDLSPVQPRTAAVYGDSLSYPIEHQTFFGTLGIEQ